MYCRTSVPRERGIGTGTSHNRKWSYGFLRRLRMGGAHELLWLSPLPAGTVTVTMPITMSLAPVGGPENDWASAPYMDTRLAPAASEQFHT